LEDCTRDNQIHDLVSHILVRGSVFNPIPH